MIKNRVVVILLIVVFKVVLIMFKLKLKIKIGSKIIFKFILVNILIIEIIGVLIVCVNCFNMKNKIIKGVFKNIIFK